MKQYTVLALSIGGKFGKTHTKGAVIDEDQLYADHIEDLKSQKAIAEYKAPDTGKKPEEVKE